MKNAYKYFNIQYVLRHINTNFSLSFFPLINSIIINSRIKKSTTTTSHTQNNIKQNEESKKELWIHGWIEIQCLYFCTYISIFVQFSFTFFWLFFFLFCLGSQSLCSCVLIVFFLFICLYNFLDFILSRSWNVKQCSFPLVFFLLFKELIPLLDCQKYVKLMSKMNMQYKWILFLFNGMKRKRIHLNGKWVKN